MKFFFVALLFFTVLLLFSISAFNQKEYELDHNDDTVQTNSNFESVNLNDEEHPSQRKETDDDSEESISNIVEKSFSSSDRAISLEVRKYLDTNDVDGLIHSIKSGTINYFQASRKTQIELSKLLTKQSNEVQFEQLIVLGIINLDTPEMFQDEIIDTYSEPNDDNELTALNKFRVLEKYGVDISYLHRTVQVNGAEESFGPLERAISTGMLNLVDYFLDRSVDLRSPEMAWGGLIVTKKGDYVETAKTMIDYGYGPDLKFAEKVLKSDILANDESLKAVFENYMEANQ